jgi:hypothetical protein
MALISSLSSRQKRREIGPISSIGIVTAPFKGQFVRAKFDLQSLSTSAVIASASELVNVLQAFSSSQNYDTQESR